MENLNKEVKYQVRATKIFKAIMKQPMTVEQLAGKVQMHKPTIHAILQRMKKMEFVLQETEIKENGQSKKSFIYSPINADKFDFRYESINEKDCDVIPTHILEAIRDGKINISIIKIHRASDVKIHTPVKLRSIEPHMQSSMGNFI